MVSHKLAGYFRNDGQLHKIVCGAIEDFLNAHNELTSKTKGSLSKRILAQIKGWVLHTEKVFKEQEFCCYHVTTKERLDNILKNGLMPNSKPSWFTSETPYVMLSLFPYWSLHRNREAWGLPIIGECDSILLEIKCPYIKREYFDDPEGLRWNKVIPPNYINAIIEFKVIKHGCQEVMELR